LRKLSFALTSLALALATLGLTTAALAAEYRHPMANKLLRREAFRAAARQYRDAHQEQPELGGPLAGLALCLCRLGEDDRARERLSAAEQLDPFEPMIFEAHACLANNAGDGIAQAEALAAAADLSADPTRLAQLGTHLQQQGLFDDAMDVAQTMKRAGYRGRSSTALTVRVLLAEGEEDLAALLAEEIAEDGRTHRSGMILSTLVAISQDDLVGEMVQPYTYYTPRTRTGDSVLLLRAEASRLLGRLDEAEQQAGRRKQEPRDPFGLAVLARVACDLGDLEAAETFVAEARQGFPLHPSPMISEALLRQRQGRHADAERLLDLAIERGIPAWDRHAADDLIAEMSGSD